MGFSKLILLNQSLFNMFFMWVSFISKPFCRHYLTSHFLVYYLKFNSVYILNCYIFYFVNLLTWIIYIYIYRIKLEGWNILKLKSYLSCDIDTTIRRQLAFHATLEKDPFNALLLGTITWNYVPLKWLILSIDDAVQWRDWHWY